MHWIAIYSQYICLWFDNGLKSENFSKTGTIHITPTGAATELSRFNAKKNIFTYFCLLLNEYSFFDIDDKTVASDNHLQIFNEDAQWQSRPSW